VGFLGFDEVIDWKNNVDLMIRNNNVEVVVMDEIEVDSIDCMRLFINTML